MLSNWKIWIDTGGTFTDCLAVSPHGEMKRLKVLSNSALRGKIISQPQQHILQVQLSWPVSKPIYENYIVKILGEDFYRSIDFVDFSENHIHLKETLPAKYAGHTIEITTNEEVPVFTARLITETSLEKNFPPLEMKLGSTRGTNAILERKGAKTAFVITKGFKDLLLIGNQQRPDLFTLNIQKEKPLYHRVIEVDERIEADGSVLHSLSIEKIQRVVSQLQKLKIESVAVALLNSYKNPQHEIALSAALHKAGFIFVSSSHELSSQVKILQRAETTVTNAYLAPIIYNYVARIQSGLSGATLKIMTSAGGLVDAGNFNPKDSLLSGPAGGVVGAATTAALSGHRHLITFDMGGTSTDVSLYNGRYDYRYESKVAGLKILSPSLAIETIAAGGGSICDFDGFRFTVGPHSAGAFPGPACYGADGPLTITDVNLLLGRIDWRRFSIPLHKEASEKALNLILKKVKKATGKTYKREAVLESFLQIANEKMAEAIKKVSVQGGFDPAEFTLLSFGGAGGQHATALATILGMSKVLVPYDAGLLSAYGIGHASIEQFEEMLVIKPLKTIKSQLDVLLNQLFEKGKRFLEKTHPSSNIQVTKQLLFLRFQGQESSLEIEYSSEIDIDESFRAKYESVFGHWVDDQVIELESLKVVVAIPGFSSPNKHGKTAGYKPIAKQQQQLWVNGVWKQTQLYSWEELQAGARITAPAIVTSQNSTIVVEPGWIFLVDENNNALLQSTSQPKKDGNSFGKEAKLELFTNRFTAIAQEMGALLQRTSFSVNVKERLDFSCALLDNEGYLVVNAPHIPVHLGSLGVCVREVKKAIRIGKGDVIITNHPGLGGSHLPDVTLIKAVYLKNELIGYVANRAHHAEIGGRKPGSMPADATSLEEEGVIIPPTYLVKKGKIQWSQIEKLLTSGEYPSRLPNENLADLNGALAAINFGEQALQNLCHTYGYADVTQYMRALRAYANRLLVQRLSQLSSRNYKAIEKLDDGTKICVAISVDRNKLKVDFTNTSPVHRGNLNATKAIVQSTVLYVLRLLVNKPIPMNEGLLTRVKILLPDCFLDPFSKMKPARIKSKNLPAVVGGNTEVSQRLTDTLLKAFKLAACSQGTMNNFLFGNNHFGYYETICGGVGAGDGFDGASAVHQHMTNTRITDPEVMELRYPVLVMRFEVRKNSGGTGKWKGGDGVIREIYFKSPLEINILSQHRVQEPFGLKGGGPGKLGTQKIIRKNGRIDSMPGMGSAEVAPGDILRIETPGGGGYGKL